MQYFEKEKYIEIENINDLIPQHAAYYKAKRYKFYWEYTHDKKFLILYQNSKKDFLKESDKLKHLYLKNIRYKSFSTDLNNKRIYYTVY